MPSRGVRNVAEAVDAGRGAGAAGPGLVHLGTKLSLVVIVGSAATKPSVLALGNRFLVSNWRLLRFARNDTDLVTASVS